MAKHPHQRPRGWLNSMSLYLQFTETIPGLPLLRGRAHPQDPLRPDVVTLQVKMTFFLHRLLLVPEGHKLRSREMATRASQRCGRVRGSVCAG